MTWGKMAISSADVDVPEEQSSEKPAGPPLVRGTPIRTLDLPGLHDFWAIYDRHYDEIRAIVIAELTHDPEIGDIIRRTPREVLDERGRESRRLTKRAIFDGEWEPYLENLRFQGANYANMGLSFGAWFRVTGAFRPHVVRHLLAAFATDTQRLVRAVDGMDHLLDLALSAIGESYLAAQADVIARQREAIGELRTRSRYQVILTSIADGVVTTDPHGNVVTLNPAMERLAGVRAHDVIGRRYDEAFPVLIGDRLLAWEERHLFRAIQERAVVNSEVEDVRLRRADGTEVPVSITSAPVVEEDGQLTGGVNVVRERQTPAAG